MEANIENTRTMEPTHLMGIDFSHKDMIMNICMKTTHT